MRAISALELTTISFASSLHCAPSDNKEHAAEHHEDARKWLADEPRSSFMAHLFGVYQIGEV